ncbi:hypothetical protein DASB73_008060 [Starmerella bacillaris]|uniref:Uncharacterized protein n=1 Tax=Starmerella bacillaris TaxID=1247836 RepID=A0AAV5REI2_STABA|nr:hypothetical protein DASB73_008060 [Starmerella bacillaris]
MFEAARQEAFMCNQKLRNNSISPVRFYKYRYEIQLERADQHIFETLRHLKSVKEYSAMRGVHDFINKRILTPLQYIYKFTNKCQVSIKKGASLHYRCIRDHAISKSRRKRSGASKNSNVEPNNENGNKVPSNSLGLVNCVGSLTITFFTEERRVLIDHCHRHHDSDYRINLPDGKK